MLDLRGDFMRRRGCLTGCLGGCLNFIIFICVIVGVWYLGTYTLKTNSITIESDKIASDITFVQITDLHGSEFGNDNSELIARIEEAEPDFIISTGDMYTHWSSKGKDTAVALLGALAERYPVYSVCGEHDNDNEYEERLENAGVDVLDYESCDIYVGESMVRLYGITNAYYSDTFDLTREFSFNKSVYNILAAHICNPDAFADAGLDLTVSGDSHGGQIRIPYYGALINQGVFLPETKEGKAKYTKGLYKVSNTDVFISGGLGNYPVPIRFLNLPEVVVFHLKGE